MRHLATEQIPWVDFICDENNKFIARIFRIALIKIFIKDNTIMAVAVIGEKVSDYSVLLNRHNSLFAVL